jgi:hypothetical protein
MTVFIHSEGETVEDAYFQGNTNSEKKKKLKKLNSGAKRMPCFVIPFLI